jgi:hypothetical protein
MSNDEKAVTAVGELLKLIPAVAGVMLGLVWGLAGDAMPDVLKAIRFASVVLVVSIFFSLLGLQFIVSALQKGSSNIAGKATVQLSFFLAWFLFLVGCVLVVRSLFLI